MLRSKIKKLTAELTEYRTYNNSKEEEIVIKDVWDSIRANDDKAIGIYESFGDDVRDRIPNIDEYRRGFVLGFEDFELDEHSLIKTPIFLNVEEVALRHSKDKCSYNYFKLGQTPNGSWGYNYRYDFGCAGGSSPLTVFSHFYSSKEECIAVALNFFKMKFEYAVLQRDTTNYKMPYCQQVLNMINEKLKPVLDYSVNKRGQILLF